MVSLPVIFAGQMAFMICTLIAIIVSFAVVTNQSVESIGRQSVLRNLDALENQIRADVLFAVPLVKLLAAKIAVNGDYCVDFSRPFPQLARHYEDHIFIEDQYPGIEYIYQSYERPNGRWTDCGCGQEYCDYGQGTGIDVVELPYEIPNPMTVVDTFEYETNDEFYVINIRMMTGQQNETGMWHPVTPYADPTSGLYSFLATFSMPLTFTTAGRITSAISIDINVDWLQESLRSRVVGGGFVYLIDANRDQLVVHSLQFSPLQPDETPWNSTATPDPRINAAVASASTPIPLSQQSTAEVFNEGEWIISKAHIKVDTMHWVAFDHTPSEYYFGESRRLQTILIIVSVLVVCLSIGIQVAVFFMVVKPLNDMSVAMDKISKLEDTEEGEAEQPPMLSELGTMHRAYTDLNKAMQSFTRYVPREVVKDLMMSGQLCECNMRSTQCTMLFVDIKGFTSMCERVPIKKLDTLIATYFDRMSSIVMHHNGIIDKFIGDCIMAVWGAPLPQDNAQLRGALCALRLRRCTEVDPLLSLFGEAGETLSVRVGVASGKVLAGNMGTEQRMNFTVIGDSVNLAARLESLNKQFATSVMVGENVAHHCKGKLVMRLLHRVRVVGKEEPVQVYELLGVYCENLVEESFVPMEVSSESGELQSQISESHPSGSAAPTPSGPGPRDDPLRRRSTWKHAYVAAHRTEVSDLLNEATLQCPVSRDELHFADLFTKAMEAYFVADFAHALELLNQMDEETKSKYTSLMSVERMFSLCEEYQRNPPKDFTGCFDASEK